jgi:PKD repeat protein
VDFPNGPVTKIENFLPNGAVTSRVVPPWDGTMDMEFGPDGSLYVLDYGSSYFRANPEAGLYRVDWAPGNKAPQASFTTTPGSSSSAPLPVTFDAGASVDPEGTALTYDWDFTNDGTFDATGVTASYTYTEVGAYTARLRVTDASGKTSVVSRQVTVGNQAPSVAISTPDGGFFDWGQAVGWAVTTNDPEEGSATACERVSMTFGLGHSTHAHPVSTGSGCSGIWATPVDAPEHGEAENIFGLIVAQYTDAGAAGVPAAAGDAQVTLNTKLMQAEWFDSQSGAEVTFDTAAAGLNKVTSLDAGDWLAWDPVNFANITGAQVKASGNGTLSFRWGAADAAPFATAAFAGSDWQTVNLTLEGALPAGTGELFVTSTGGVDVDQLQFLGSGVADATPPTASATLNPATPNGSNGWYTSDVVVTVDGTDNAKVRFREYSLDNGATWVQIPLRISGFELPGDFELPASFPLPPFTVTVSTPGVNTVLYRTTDYSGLHSEVGTLTIKIDKAAPTVTASGIADGASYGDSIYVSPSWTATDAASGLASTTATLDGQVLRRGMPLRLATLALGEHTVVITSRDAAGNTDTTQLTFTVTTSYDDVDALIGQYLSSKTLTSSTAASLRDRLARAEAAAAAGQETKAASYLEQFAAKVKSQVKATALRSLLLRDAQALQDQLDS